MTKKAKQERFAASHEAFVKRLEAERKPLPSEEQKPCSKCQEPIEEDCPVKDVCVTYQKHSKPVSPSSQKPEEQSTEMCGRCEGSGKIYADHRAHYPSEHAPTTDCPECGGEGRVPIEPVSSPKPEARPKIVCLCGSTRFTADMLVVQWEFTKKGYIVLSWCALPDSYYKSEDKAHIGDQEGVKELVDEIHKRKIDLSDEVFVINIGGYIGKSTRSEIDYALAHGKPVRYLEAQNG